MITLEIENRFWLNAYKTSTLVSKWVQKFRLISAETIRTWNKTPIKKGRAFLKPKLLAQGMTTLDIPKINLGIRLKPRSYTRNCWSASKIISTQKTILKPFICLKLLPAILRVCLFSNFMCLLYNGLYSHGATKLKSL